MTRIRSPRELRIVAPERPPAGRPAGDDDAPAKLFSMQYDAARQALRQPDTVPGRHDDERGDEQEDERDDDAQSFADDPVPDESITAGDAPPANLFAPASEAALAHPVPPPPRLQSSAPGHALGARRGAARGKSAVCAVDGDRALGAKLVRRCAQAAKGDLVAERLAECIANFCSNPTIEQAGRWEVVVELDPAILPRTRMHLALSGYRLSLRFDCADPRSRRLICNNSHELRTRLEARLDFRLPVEVAVT